MSTSTVTLPASRTRSASASVRTADASVKAPSAAPNARSVPGSTSSAVPRAPGRGVPAGRSAATVAASSRRCCSDCRHRCLGVAQVRGGRIGAFPPSGCAGAGDLGPPFRTGGVGTLAIIAEGRQAEHRLLVGCRQLDAAPVGALGGARDIAQPLAGVAGDRPRGLKCGVRDAQPFRRPLVLVARVVQRRSSGREPRGGGECRGLDIAPRRGGLGAFTRIAFTAASGVVQTLPGKVDTPAQALGRTVEPARDVASQVVVGDTVPQGRRRDLRGALGVGQRLRRLGVPGRAAGDIARRDELVTQGRGGLIGGETPAGRDDLLVKVGRPRRGTGLALECRLSARQLGRQIAGAIQALAHACQLGLGAAAAAARQGHAGRLLDHGAEVRRAGRADSLHLTLPDHRQRIGAQSESPQRFVDIQEATRGAVELVGRVTGAGQATGDLGLRGLIVLGMSRADRHANLGEPRRWAALAAREDHLGHAGRPQPRRPLFPHRPDHRLGKIALARPVRADNHIDARPELQVDRCRERLEAAQMNSSQHQTWSVISGSTAVAAARSDDCFEVPVPTATSPPTVTRVVNSRRCAGPSTLAIS